MGPSGDSHQLFHLPPDDQVNVPNLQRRKPRTKAPGAPEPVETVSTLPELDSVSSSTLSMVSCAT